MTERVLTRFEIIIVFLTVLIDEVACISKAKLSASSRIKSSNPTGVELPYDQKEDWKERYDRRFNIVDGKRVPRLRSTSRRLIAGKKLLEVYNDTV